jgi:CelD/BcsL family acetyltransferase involved in cellulose biosynthesis
VTTTASPARPTTARPVLVTVTRVVAALFGLLKLSATTYFLFFASAEAGGDPQGAFDWTVGVWSLALGAGYLVIAARLGRDARVLPLAVGLAVADTAFSAVKFFIYDETAPIPFTVAILVLLALVVASARPRRTA